MITFNQTIYFLVLAGCLGLFFNWLCKQARKSNGLTTIENFDEFIDNVYSGREKPDSEKLYYLEKYFISKNLSVDLSNGELIFHQLGSGGKYIDLKYIHEIGVSNDENNFLELFIETTVGESYQTLLRYL